MQKICNTNESCQSTSDFFPLVQPVWLIKTGKFRERQKSGYEPPLTLADILVSGSTLHEEKPRRIRLSLRKVMDSRILSQSTTSSDSVFCLSECIAIDVAFPTSNRGSLRRNFFKCKTSKFLQPAIILSYGLETKKFIHKKQETEINLCCCCC